MKKIKFHSDFVVGGVLFQRNSIWEYYDKHDEVAEEDCDESLFWETIYRIKIDDSLYRIKGCYVVEVDDVGRYNKDYTKEQWRDKVTKDSMVEDGDYVKMWRKTYNINKPVKDRAEQTDYDSSWNSTARRAREYFKDKGD